MAKNLSIATFNLLNLALPGQATRPGSTPIERPDYDRKLRWIGDKLSTLKANLIGFQEVWSAQALAECFAAAGLGERYRLVSRDAPPGLVQVAAAVDKRLPLAAEPAWIEDFPPETRLVKRAPAPGEPLNTMNVEIARFSRPVLHLQVKVGSKTVVHFLVLHLKSKLAMDLDRPEASDPAIRPHAKALGEALSTIRRTAEVVALRVLLNKLIAGNDIPVIVAGDLNDGHMSTTAAILAAQPPVKLFAASRVGAKATKAGDVGLYAAQMLQELRSLRDIYYTYDHENILESLDHIFVSQEFYDHAPDRLWSFRELVVLNDHIHTRSDRSRIESDHGIVCARFDFNPVV
jgi:hypothetical protein